MHGDLMGTGYLGELREAPDGQLYQWVEGVDGLGNPVGFWKALRRRVRGAVRRLAPLATRAAGMLPGPYGAVARRALDTATPWLRRAGLTGADGLGQLYQAPDGEVYQVHGLADGSDLEGLGHPGGIGQLGEVRAGGDGHLYQWVETVNGLGEPVGFWKRLRRLARKALPLVQKYSAFVPGYGTAISAGLKTAAPWLKRAGLSADDEAMAGLAAEQDLEGLDEDVDGLDAEDLEGLDEGAADLEGYVPPTAPPTGGPQPTHFAPLW
ncbi:MAG: hypothetical protein SFV24_00425 [Gemmatimonadales bacterium]|nr:hypothetical protein [Gemmatimonadales bacterium]